MRIIEKNNCEFVVGLKRMQDVIFNLNVMNIANVVIYINTHLYHYRINSNSVCVKYNPNIFKIFFEVIKNFKIFIDNKKMNNDIYQQCLNMKIILMYIEGLRISVLHNDNKENYFCKIKKIKELYKELDIYNAFKKIKFKYLSFSLKMFVIANRMHMFWLVHFMIIIFMRTKLNEQK